LPHLRPSSDRSPGLPRSILFLLVRETACGLGSAEMDCVAIRCTGGGGGANAINSYPACLPVKHADAESTCVVRHSRVPCFRGECARKREQGKAPRKHASRQSRWVFGMLSPCSAQRSFLANSPRKHGTPNVTPAAKSRTASTSLLGSSPHRCGRLGSRSAGATQHEEHGASMGEHQKQGAGGNGVTGL
jgi:hypothetical protein